MDKINKIVNNPEYNHCISLIKEREQDRVFCRHDFTHFLETARIAYIIAKEERLNYTKEIIYAAALLHDVGRWKEYDFNILHEIASAEIADSILRDAGFFENDIQIIIEAIRSHSDENATGLGALLFYADKKSRLCFLCNAALSCKWNDEKKNKIILY